LVLAEKTEAGEIRNHSHRRLERHRISRVPRNITGPRRRFGVLQHIVLQDTETILMFVAYILFVGEFVGKERRAGLNNSSGLSFCLTSNIAGVE
jgi:hypothetical protein